MQQVYRKSNSLRRKVDCVSEKGIQLKIKSMEVHHHAHTPGKKWTHYFWEFLMLFLAVFCGFIAENEREHYVEHQREKQFVKQIVADLRTDSAFFVKRMAFINRKTVEHQQFLNLMTALAKPSAKEILNGCLPLMYTYDVQITTAAYNQMKTSGSLRYLRNENVRTTLQQYYEVLLPRISNGAEMEARYYYDH